MPLYPSFIIIMFRNFCRIYIVNNFWVKIRIMIFYGIMFIAL